MVLINFQNQFKRRGVSLTEYGGQCFFGESSNYSLVLAPCRPTAVSKASLAIRTKTSEERKNVVAEFFRAAGVQPNGDIAEALNGREYRGDVGSRHVTVAVLDDEFIVTVSENPSVDG